MDGTGRQLAAGRRRSLPDRASEPARARKPIVHFSVQLCFVSKYNSEPSHAPNPSRCTLRSRQCVIRRHAHPWPATHAGQSAPRHIFRSSPPGCQCARASVLLLTPPRAMRCEPAPSPCGSMIASSRLTGAMPTSSAPWPWRWPPHVTHHHGHVASPTQAHEFPARPAGSARSASRIFSGIPPLEVLC